MIVWGGLPLSYNGDLLADGAIYTPPSVPPTPTRQETLGVRVGLPAP